MIVKPYRPEYKGKIEAWLKKRGIDTKVVADLPEVGFISPNVAAGFLRKVEGNFGMIDSFITNPEASPHNRNEALDKITESLVRTAYGLGMKQLLAISVDENTLKRAVRLGFSLLDHRVVAITLTSGKEVLQ